MPPDVFWAELCRPDRQVFTSDACAFAVVHVCTLQVSLPNMIRNFVDRAAIDLNDLCDRSAAMCASDAARMAVLDAALHARHSLLVGARGDAEKRSELQRLLEAKRLQLARLLV